MITSVASMLVATLHLGDRSTMASDHSGFLQFLSRHLLSLACVHEPTTSDDTVGPMKFFTSGFVIEISGVWLYVTAGHVFQDIQTLMERTPTRRYRFMLADCFGPDVVSDVPIPLDYKSTSKQHLYDRQSGYDFGIMLINDNARRLLVANGIVPLVEENWKHQAGVEFFHYSMVGFPAQAMILDHPEFASVKPFYIPLERLDAAPAAVEHHTVPMFYARIPKPTQGLDIRGMSGCPIYGFAHDGHGGASYYFLAIQSSWLPDSKIICACQMPFLGGLLREAIDSIAGGEEANS
jgi:hypothetical protein